MAFIPPQEILERYGRLTVQFGLRDGEGIKPGETVLVMGHEDAKPLYYEICREIWRQGGHVIHGFSPENDGDYNFTAAYYELAGPAQLEHLAEAHLRGLLAEIDHMVSISGTRNPLAGRDVNPAKAAQEAPAIQRGWEIRQVKERAGQLLWTIVLWGTEALAAEAGLSIEAYWDQIIFACFLDDPDPVQRSIESLAEIHRYRDWLNALDIDRLHVEAEGTDLWLTLGEARKWIGGGGANIPSFEIYTSPDWRGTQGTIRFTEPLYAEGQLLRGVELEFKDGEVIRADAQEGAATIQSMVARPGANRVGEFSMTDARLSRISKFMANTLYDENTGGPYGNSHLAIGLSYTDTFEGDEASVSEAEWERLGYNTSASLHCDIITTADRTITATLKDGTTQVIYADGTFQLDEPGGQIPIAGLSG